MGVKGKRDRETNSQRSFNIPESFVARYPGVARRYGGQHGVKLAVLAAVSDETLHCDGDVDPRKHGIATQEPDLCSQNSLRHRLTTDTT